MNRFILIPAILICLWMTGCFSQSGKPKQKVVFVSILPLKYFADRIAGNNYRVEVTVPPGAGPETYAPTPKQMILLSESQAYFSIGYLGFEQVWLENFKSSNPDLPVFATSKRIDLIKDEHHDGDHEHLQGVDPHIWSSPVAARLIAENIYSGMLQIDPVNGDTYRKNYNSLLVEIAKVDSTVKKILADAPSRKFIIFHPALGYFARDYGLEQLSIEFEGKVPSPRHMQEIIDASKSGNVRIVLIQKEFDKRNAEIIASETGCKMLQIDPLNYNWPEQMVDIARKISDSK